MIVQFAFCLKPRSDIHRARNACYGFSALTTIGTRSSSSCLRSRVRYILSSCVP